jgi:hypothetical protein
MTEEQLRDVFYGYEILPAAHRVAIIFVVVIIPFFAVVAVVFSLFVFFLVWLFSKADHKSVSRDILDVFCLYSMVRLAPLRPKRIKNEPRESG